jgi:hypothetical protein
MHPAMTDTPGWSNCSSRLGPAVTFLFLRYPLRRKLHAAHRSSGGIAGTRVARGTFRQGYGGHRQDRYAARAPETNLTRHELPTDAGGIQRAA